MAKLSFPNLRRGSSRQSLVAMVGALLISLFASHAAYQSAQTRGVTAEAVWMLEASDQRVPYYRVWLKKDAGSTKNPELIHQSFGGHAAIPALMPALIGMAKASGLAKGPTIQVARRVQALLFACLILLIAALGLAAGGPVGALVAALGAALTPRLFALASAPGLGLAAVLVLTLTATLLHLAARSRWATLGATLALVAAHHVVNVGLFIWIPWLFIVLGRPRQVEQRDALAATPPAPLRNVVIVPIAILMAFKIYPFLDTNFKDHVHIWLTHFLRQPPEFFLYAGRLWGPERLPWHAAPLILVVTTPLVFLLLAVAGYRAGPSYRWLMQRPGLSWLAHMPWAPQSKPEPTDTHDPPDGLFRLARTMLFYFLLMPLVMRGPYFSGVDLIALAVPWLLVFAAAGAGRLLPRAHVLIPWSRLPEAWRTQQKRSALKTMVCTLALLFVALPPVLGLQRVSASPEIFYSSLIGGPTGGLRKGYALAPKHPVPLDLLNQLVTTHQIQQLAVMPMGAIDLPFWRLQYEQEITPALRLVADASEAQAVLLVYDSQHPGYAAAASTFYETLHNNPEQRVFEVKRAGVTIFSVILK